MIGLLYMMARDQEMPRQFKRLNHHGVPIWPLAIAIGLPVVVLLFASNFTALAGLYAIGVVGAITVNLGSCTFNRTIGFTWYDRVLFGITFVILAFVELTLAHTQTRRPSIRSGNFDRRPRVACLYFEASRPHHSHRHARSCADGHARSCGEHATAFGRRPKNHGGGARNHASAQLCDG